MTTLKAIGSDEIRQRLRPVSELERPNAIDWSNDAKLAKLVYIADLEDERVFPVEAFINSDSQDLEYATWHCIDDEDQVHACSSFELFLDEGSALMWLIAALSARLIELEETLADLVERAENLRRVDAGETDE